MSAYKDFTSIVWLFGSSVAVCALIAVLIWVVVLIRTRFRDDDDPDADHHQMLLQVGDLHRRGDLTEEEFRSIKGRLLERIEGSPSARGTDLRAAHTEGTPSDPGPPPTGGTRPEDRRRDAGRRTGNSEDVTLLEETANTKDT